jgi:ribose transport system permease protein
VTLALVTAELDLAFANLASLAAVVTGYLVHKGHAIPLAVGAGLGVGTLGGLLNGLIVTRLKIPSLIATLGTAAVANGLAFWATQGVAFVGRWPAEFTSLARGAAYGIPAPVVWVVATALLALFMLKETPLGLHMTATGDADEAARLAGISTARMKLIGMTLSGVCAGIGAVLLTANLSSAAPNMAGDYLLQAIAAVLLGMTMFEPGHANVPGALIGATILALLNNGLVLIGAPYFMQDILLGLTIVAAVAFSASTLKRAAFAV